VVALDAVSAWLWREHMGVDLPDNPRVVDHYRNLARELLS
jgi:hypothetical protein